MQRPIAHRGVVRHWGLEQQIAVHLPQSLEHRRLNLVEGVVLPDDDAEQFETRIGYAPVASTPAAAGTVRSESGSATHVSTTP